MSVEYTNKQKKVLFDRINNLSSTEHEEIFRIIKNNMVSYSQNKNGIFFNLSSLPGDVVKEIDSFVHFCLLNQKDLDEYDKIINECKMNNNIRTSLAHMGKTTLPCSIVCPPKLDKEQWRSVKVDDTVMDKYIRFVDMVVADKEKITRKKMNVKFNNAKKRYSKKIAEKKIEIDQGDVLCEEPFLLS